MPIRAEGDEVLSRVGHPAAPKDFGADGLTAPHATLAGRRVRARKLMEHYSIATFVNVVRQRIETEGLRPFAVRTGIPLGQMRSFLQGRAARYTTVQAIASVMGRRLIIGPTNPAGTGGAALPAELTRALDLPSDASVVEAVEAINKDERASNLRGGIRLAQEMTELATVAAELLPQLADEPARRIVPLAEHVRFDADTAELEFEESSDLSIAVAERVLPAWSRADRLTCVQVVSDSPEATDRALVVVDRDRRVPVDEALFVVSNGPALVLRRSRWVQNGWNLMGDGSAHAPSPMTGDTHIVGRVAWCCPHGVSVA